MTILEQGPKGSNTIGASLEVVGHQTDVVIKKQVLPGLVNGHERKVEHDREVTFTSTKYCPGVRKTLRPGETMENETKSFKTMHPVTAG